MCEGYAIGCATVVGQWAGARRPASARSAAGAAARVAAASMLPIGVLGWVGARWAATLFAQDPLVVSAAASYLRIVSVTFPCMALEAVYEGALTGVQQTFAVLLVGTIFNIARVPLASCLSRHWGVEGVWAAIAISSALKAPAKWVCFRKAPMDRITTLS